MKKTALLLICLAVTATLSFGCSETKNENNTENSTQNVTEEVTEAAQTEDPAAETTEAPEAVTTAVTDAEEPETAEDEEEDYTTGDATLDKIRNEDSIGEKELLVLSFGTSFNDSRRLTIGAVEETLEKAFPEYSVRRGFTANIVINHIQKRDGILIDDIDASLKRAVDNEVKTLVVQPTHLMSGIEYDEITEKVASYSDAFEKVVFGKPLLTSDDDFKRVETAITDWTKEYDDGETAIVFMGHGTEHESNQVYGKMQDLLARDGFANYFIGTVEAEPSLEDVIAKVKEGGYRKVVLEPLMVVAGDHANNDMAGDDEDSWKSAFKNEGLEVECLLRGLGENEAIREIYADHAKAAIEEAEK